MLDGVVAFNAAYWPDVVRTVRGEQFDALCFRRGPDRFGWLRLPHDRALYDGRPGSKEWREVANLLRPLWVVVPTNVPGPGYWYEDIPSPYFLFDAMAFPDVALGAVTQREHTENIRETANILDFRAVGKDIGEFLACVNSVPTNRRPDSSLRALPERIAVVAKFVGAPETFCEPDDGKWLHSLLSRSDLLTAVDQACLGYAAASAKHQFLHGRFSTAALPLDPARGTVIVLASPHPIVGPGSFDAGCLVAELVEISAMAAEPLLSSAWALLSTFWPAYVNGCGIAHGSALGMETASFAALWFVDHLLANARIAPRTPDWRCLVARHAAAFQQLLEEWITSSAEPT